MIDRVYSNSNAETYKSQNVPPRSMAILTPFVSGAIEPIFEGCIYKSECQIFTRSAWIDRRSHGRRVAAGHVYMPPWDDFASDPRSVSA